MKPLDSDFSDTHLPFFSVNSGKGREVGKDLYYFGNEKLMAKYNIKIDNETFCITRRLK